MKLLPLLFLTALVCSALAQSNYNQTTVTVSPEDGVTPMTVIANLAGICAAVNKIKDTGKIVIVKTLHNGAADKAGVLADDEIIQIDTTKTEGMDLQAAAGMLRGDPGTTVKLTLKRKDTEGPIIVNVTREIVNLRNEK